MRSFRKRMLLISAACVAIAGGCGLRAGAVLPEWMRTVIGGSPIEAALFRMMDVPGLSVLYARPPAEAVPALSELVAKTPADAQLYALRAHAEEEALDFAAAERDWKAAVVHSQDAAAAEMQLADFYHRRLQPKEEIEALLRAANAPSPASERFKSAEKQRSWMSFERVLDVVKDQALSADVSVAADKAWIARYPAEPSVRAAYVNLLIEQKMFGEAKAAIALYKRAFPQDEVFPIQAAAAVAYAQGSTAEVLALYDRAYQPLWPQELIQSYYRLLVETHGLRRVLAAEQAKFAIDPNDYSAAARVFQLLKQQGRNDAATRALAEYRLAKESRKLAWSADELYTFAVLLDRAGMYPAAARHYFALASAQGKLTLSDEAPQQVAMAALVRILLAQPDQPLDLGAGNLAMYKDIATIDQGPGYWNGILSLWLNSEDPAAEFHDQEQKATVYFHQAKASELLALMDQRFPNAAEGAELHAALINTYGAYGDDAAVLKAGTAFLAKYPNAAQRVEIALMMADAYARKEDTASEFALYESLLTELSARSSGMPLTAAGAAPLVKPVVTVPQDASSENDEAVTNAKPPAPPLQIVVLRVGAATPVDNSDAILYSQVLERYLGRLTMNKRLPEALAVLRRQLDRNPDDPLLYARLADFLQQNDLSAQQEEVYTRAIAKFNQPTFYDKLARFYLRQKRREDFAGLTRKVVDTFSGTELESYFANVPHNGGWGQMYVQLNLYAHKRFPHDLTFTRNLLSAYRMKGTRDDAAWEQLIREHWTESEDLRNEFFDFLARTGKMDAELAALGKLAPDQKDFAAVRELAEIDVWQSHFEAGAPLMGAVAKAYPADEVAGEEASSLYRSLAYYDPPQIEKAVRIEKNLLTADPANTDRLARIGDIYADSTSSALNLDPQAQLAQAAPYWRRIPAVHPGTPGGYLQAATIFWDYFEFDSALSEIDAARKQFHQPALYGYEAGAIYENKRDPADAVAEYVAAASADGASASNEAPQRLLILSERPVYGAMVDAATAKAAAERPSIAALSLRVAVLRARKQSAGIAPLVDSAIAASATAKDAAGYAAFAQQHDLPLAYRHGLEREIVLMRPEISDATDRIALQYELVAALEQNGRAEDLAQAQGIVDAVYRENPKLLGVVRSTVDFDWKHKRGDAAIAVLMQSAKDSSAELRASFTEEAASKSNASGEYAQARTLLGPMLERDPYDAKLIAIYAESYALAKDSDGLRNFYLARLAMLKDAKLPPDLRRDNTALMRQGLIAALTDLKDYAGATDQQIALISAFPEDASVLQQAALYALRYGRQAQLFGFLNKTVAESPRDSRFAIDLARTDTIFEDYAGALAAYSKAIAIRKDRPDLYIARADIEERTQAFDAACADYDRLYVLSYKDPQWMEKAALARARQGKNDLAVKALQTGWIEGRPPSAANYFRVASQLEAWRIVEPARVFAEQGIELAGDDLLTKYASDGAALYARIMMRERHWGETLAFLDKALAAADVSASSPSIVVEQVERKGIASVTDAEWRRHFAAQKKQQAQAGYLLALGQAGKTAAELYTPEEKLGYAELLDARRGNRPMEEVASVWIPAAEAAGLKDREAAWRRDVLLHGSRELAEAQLGAFNALEDQRMDDANHARTLEEYAALLKPAQRAPVLLAAEAAWRADANHADELRVLREIRGLTEAPPTDERYFELLLRSNPNALVAENTDASANFVLVHASGAKGDALAYRAVDARARQRKPVWGPATTALTGLFFADASPKIDAAFHTALGDMTIAERLKRADPDKEIVGKTWFDYGMRYGLYRGLVSAAFGDAEDYLVAGLEEESGSSASYITLASAYADAKKIDAALAEYDHALELTNDSASIHIAKAELLWSADRHPQAHSQAIDEWKKALMDLRSLVDARAVPESFWIDFASVARDLRERGIGVQFKPELEAVLRPYIVKNGYYRSGELLHSALIAVSKPLAADAIDGEESLASDEASTSSIVGLAEASSDPGSLLAELCNEAWFPRGRLGPVYARRLQLAEAAAAARDASQGSSEDTYSSYGVESLRSSYLKFLIQRGQFSEADRVYDGIPKQGRGKGDLPQLSILLRAHEGRTDELLASFAADPASAPALNTIAAAADALRNETGDQAERSRNKEAARALREYVFARKLELNELAAPDYLALAQSRLESPAAKPDVAGALDLLHRMTMLPGDLYANIDSAADLLVRSGHGAEALPFLKVLASANPWVPEYRLRLAKAETAEGKQPEVASEALIELASNSDAPYSLRARAAEADYALPGQPAFACPELTLLAANAATPAQAEPPYFVRARELAAASAPPAARPGILLAAIGFAPSDRLRLAVFRAEVAAGADERALAAVTPLLNDNRGYGYGYGYPTDDQGDSDASGSEAANDTDERIPVVMPAVLSSHAERLAFALEMAKMDERLGQDGDTANWLMRAADLSLGAGQKAAIAKRLAAARERLRVSAENAARRPVVQPSLDQAVVVRPRVSPAAMGGQP